MSASVSVAKSLLKMPAWVLVVALLAGPATAPALQQTSKSTAAQAPPAKAGARKTDPAVKPAAAMDPAASATKIAELRSQIDGEEKQLEGLKKQLADQALPESKFSKAEARFKSIDAKLKEQKAKLADLQSREQPDAELVAEVNTEIHDTEEARAGALKAFELEIVENKTLQEKILTIEKKITADKAALERLSKPAETATPAATAAGTTAARKTGEKESTTKAEEKPEPEKTGSKPGEPAKKPENSVASLVASTATGGLIGKKPAEPKAGEKKPESDETEEKKAEADDSKLARRVQDQIAKFQDDIADLNSQLETARQDETMATELVANLDKQVTLEAQLRDNARKKADLLNEQVSKAQDDFRDKSLGEASQEVLTQLADKLLELQKEFQAAREGSRRHSNRLQDIQNERAKQQETL
ncbi:MAG: hypothetical protein ACKO0V_19900, partial [bacterium]